jgi:CRP-like cAMP-binding protein
MPDQVDVPAAVMDAEAEPRRNGVVVAHADERNLLLGALSVPDYEALVAELRPVSLDLKHVLVEPNVPIADVWLVRAGVVSMVTTESQGGTIEVGTIGREGFVGLPLLHGLDTSPYRLFVQIPGDALCMRADAFRRAIETLPTFRRACLRFAQFFCDQVAQSLACNQLHTVDERCARWLLMTHDRVAGDTFELTQEFLAMMLAVRRAGVSVAMSVLQREGIVAYVRGRVHIIDRPRLEEAACGCYRGAREARRQVFG